MGTISIPAATTAPVPPYCVYNCAVTRILGFYTSPDAATIAAAEFGGASFAYELSATDQATINAACAPLEPAKDTRR